MRGFGDRRVDSAELQERGHIFSKHFQQPSVNSGRDIGVNALDALVAAAQQVQSSSRDASLSEGRRDSMLTPGLQFSAHFPQANLAFERHTESASRVATDITPAAPQETDCCALGGNLALDIPPCDWNAEENVEVNYWGEEWMQVLATSSELGLQHRAAF